VTVLKFTRGRCWGPDPSPPALLTRAPGGGCAHRTIRTAETVPVGSGVAYACLLTDGTGELGLVFLGRPDVPGLVPGVCCTVDGTARMVSGSLVVWNPRYRFEREAPL